MQTVIQDNLAASGRTGQEFGDGYRLMPERILVEMMVLDGHVFDADPEVSREEARAALQRFREMGLATRRSDSGLLYDPVEVAWFAKRASQNGEDDYFHAHEVETARRLVTEGPGEAPSNLSMRYTRIFDLGDFPAGETRRLRMPLPLEARYGALRIAPELPPEVTRHRVSDGRLEAKVTSTGSGLVRIGTRLELLPGDVEPEGPPDSDIYLREQEGMVIITPEIRALAQRLAGDANAENALRAFWKYLIETMMFCQVHYDQVPADAPLDWVLRTGHYDCQLGSSLLVGLCRARGIPARLVGGNFLYQRSPTNHYWTEVWLENEGWFPVDFIGWVLSRGGRDEKWRDFFFGRLDARLIAECQPKSFVGTLGVALPGQWTMLRAPMTNGAAVSLARLDGREVYRDEITFP